MRRITAEMSQWRLQRCTGKNLMPPIPVITVTVHGVTMQLDADGVITLNGTATNSIFQNFQLTKSFTYPAGARTHVRNNAVGNGGNVVLAWLSPSAVQMASVTQNTINKIGNAASADMDIRYIRVTIANGTTLDNYQMRPSVEMTDVASPYEPYCGGSPNRIEIANCKGGYFSTLPDYGLRVEGATLQDGTPTPDNPAPIQCVKAGTKVRAGSPMTTATAWINTSNQLAYSSDSFAVRLPIKPSTKYELYLDTAVSSLFRAGVTYSATLPVTGEPITLSPCVRDNAPNHITLTTSSGAKYIWIQIAKSQMQAIYSLTVIDKGTGMSYKPFAVSEVIVPCDLYEGDVWFPMTGDVIRHNTSVEHYDPQPIFAPQGTVNVLQSPTDLPARLSATMMVRR